MIGCDPELIVASRSGGHKSAREYLAFQQAVYVKSRSTEEVGSIGTDAAGVQAEIRPKPGPKALDVVKRIRLLLAHVAQHLPPDVRLYAGSAVHNSRYTYGGHIHFSSGGVLSWSPAIPIILSPLMTFTDLLEPPEQVLWRARTDYGNPYAWRAQSHNCVELRAPSGVWLAHPGLSRCFLDLVNFALLRIFQVLRVKPTDKNRIVDTISTVWDNLGIGKDGYWPKRLIRVYSDMIVGDISSVETEWRTYNSYVDDLRHPRHLAETLEYIEKVSARAQDVGKLKFFAQNLHRLRRKMGVPVSKTWKLQDINRTYDLECVRDCPNRGKVLKVKTSGREG